VVRVCLNSNWSRWAFDLGIVLGHEQDVGRELSAGRQSLLNGVKLAFISRIYLKWFEGW
jgi:hypothetical protein